VPSLPAPKANIGTQVNKKYYSMRAFIAILSRQLTVSRVQSLHITVIKLAYWNKQQVVGKILTKGRTRHPWRESTFSSHIFAMMHCPLQTSLQPCAAAALAA